MGIIYISCYYLLNMYLNYDPDIMLGVTYMYGYLISIPIFYISNYIKLITYIYIYIFIYIILYIVYGGILPVWLFSPYIIIYYILG